MSTSGRGGPGYGGPPGRPPQRPFQQGGGGGSWPPDYLKSGYFDEKGNLLSAVVVEWPRQIATMFDAGYLQMAQLRKFFAEVRLIEGQLISGMDFGALKPRILKLESYAFDSVKKGKAPQVFKEFFEKNIKWASANKKGFLEGFVHHFECVVAYFPKAK
jgi:CRISPR/Cas system CSM-associated protein Csm2 small subunit